VSNAAKKNRRYRRVLGLELCSILRILIALLCEVRVASYPPPTPFII
jgi:hypothetical protein